MTKQFYSIVEAADLLGISPTTLEAWRYRGGGPAYLCLGKRRCIRYRFAGLLNWAESGRRRSTSDPGPEGE